MKKPVVGYPEPHRCYLAGLDLGKHVDYTVMTIADINTYEICDQFRFNKFDWDEQADMIQEYSKKYKNCPIYMDSTGVGDSMVDRLKNRGMTIYPMVFSNTTKKQMIQNLVVMLQNEEIAIPDDDVCIKEFERFEFTLLPSGAIKYAAPARSMMITSVRWLFLHGVLNTLPKQLADISKTINPSLPIRVSGRQILSIGRKKISIGLISRDSLSRLKANTLC